MNDPLTVFLHIHKCAGTTLRHHVMTNHPREETLALRKKVDPNFEDQTYVSQYLAGLDDEAKKNINFVMGHGAFYGVHNFFPGRTPRYVTFVRQPFDRMVSNYNYFIQTLDRGHKSRQSIINQEGGIKSFKEWIDTTPSMKDYMTRFLFMRMYGEPINGDVYPEHLKAVQRKLRDFHFIGDTARRDDQLFFYSQAGVTKFADDRNLSQKHYHPDENDRRHFDELNQQDYRLYDFSLDLNRQFREANAELYQGEVERMRALRDAQRLEPDEFRHESVLDRSRR